MGSNGNTRPGKRAVDPHAATTADTLAAPVDAGGAEWLHEGHVVAGRWRVVRFIAAGGMGEVYEVEDVALGERVALKTIRREAAREGRALERFKREVLLARKIAHPNVCRLFEFGFDGPLAFLTMELLDGETLSARLRSRGALPAEEARAIALQLCAALEAAHAAQVVHRDLKSNNILLVGERAVVTDFGLARGLAPDDDQSLTAGAMIGTPAYMAPEQVDGRPVGAPTDVYALGVVLFEMLAGRRPFEGDSGLVLALRRLREDAPSLRKVAPQVDAVWARIVAACLEREPARRPTLGELTRAIAEHRPPAPPVGARRRRVLVGGGVLSAGVAMGIALTVAVARAPRPRLDEGLYPLRPPAGLASEFVDVRNRVARREAGGAARVDALLAAAPDHAPTRVLRALLDYRQGRITEARAAAERARAAAASLDAHDRAWVEAFTAPIARPPDPAAGLRRLVSEAPGCVECAVELARLLIADGQRREAASVVRRARELPPPLGNDPALLVQEARAEEDPARRRASLEAVVAATKGSAVGLFALAAQNLAWERLMQGDLEGALAVGLDARNACLAVDDAAGEIGVIHTMATARALTGELPFAERLFDEGIARARAARLERSLARLLVSRALLSARTGRFSAARADLDEASSTLRLVPSAELDATALLARSRIGLLTGQLRETARALSSGLATVRRADQDERVLAGLLVVAGELSRELDSLDEARARAAEARAETARVNNVLDELAARLLAAQLLVDDGRLVEGERELSQVAAAARRFAMRDVEAWAQAALARVALARGRVDEARAIGDAAMVRLSATSDLALRTELRIVAARIKAEDGARADAARSLHALVEELDALGAKSAAMEARLALVQIAEPTERASAARALAAEAVTAGFGRVARVAAALAKSSGPRSVAPR